MLGDWETLLIKKKRFFLDSKSCMNKCVLLNGREWGIQEIVEMSAYSDKKANTDTQWLEYVLLLSL